MKYTITSIFVALVFFLRPASAQQQGEAKQQPQPKTKLEQFQANTGSVIIMAYDDVAPLQGQNGAAVYIQVREFTNATSGDKQSGILIKVKQTSPIEHEENTYIDSDEIESLIKGVDYIAGITNGVTTLPGFQADYSTKGGLKISVFLNPKKKVIEACIASNNYYSSNAFFSLSDLTKFRKLLQSSLATLESLKTR